MGKVKGRKNESGSVTGLFLTMIILVLGAISYSYFVGETVNNKISLTNSADGAAISMASRSSQGLNMISANNLAIGASIHVAGATRVLAVYGSVAKAASFGIFNLGRLVASKIAEKTKTELMDPIQADVYNKIAPFTAWFMRIASGLTQTNSKTAEYWLYTSALRGIEVGRLNSPGSLVVPLQPKSQISQKSIQFKYRGLIQMSPKNTICHAISSSETLSVKDRANVVGWLTGPFKSLANLFEGQGRNSSKISEGFSLLSNAVDEVLSLGGAAPFHFTDCGYGMGMSFHSLIESLIDKVLDVAEDMSSILSKPVGWICGGKAYLCFLDTEFINSVTGVKIKGEILSGIHDVYQEVRVLVTKTWVRQGLDRFMNGRLGTTKEDPCETEYKTWINGKFGIGGIKNDINDHRFFAELAFERYYLRRTKERAIKSDPDAYLSMVNANEEEDGIYWRDIDDRCPVIKVVMGSNKIAPLNCGTLLSRKIFKRWSGWYGSSCNAYEKYSRPKKDLSPLVAFPLLDFGKQADALIRAKNGTSTSWIPRRSNQSDFAKGIGFLVPQKGNTSFEDSLIFAIGMGKSTKFVQGAGAIPKCPEPLQTKLPDGSTGCETYPSMSFTPTQDAMTSEALGGEGLDQSEKIARAKAIANTYTGGINNLTDGRSGSLDSPWARTQWAFGGAKSYYDDNGIHNGGAMTMFWPAWGAKNVSTDISQDLLKIIFPAKTEN